MKLHPLLHPYIERTLSQLILKDLANKGRPNWDKPHTETVVHWMKTLLPQINQNRTKDEQLSPKVMITAAYAHDWGYTGLFPDRVTLTTIDQSTPHKDLHMKRSVEKIERLIAQRLSGYFTQSEVLQLTHLISVHDHPKKLQTEDEILLMECDALGMLDVERVPPTLSAKENEHFMKHSIYARRLPRFTHEEAKRVAKELIEKRERYYQAEEI